MYKSQVCLFPILVLSFGISWVGAPLSLAQAPQPKAASTKPPATPDPRVQQRTYHFDEAKQDLPYALFVSSKVTRDRKAPLIVALHGLGGEGNHLLHDNALDLAEMGGYIMVGPMGYNRQGWFGAPAISRTDGKRMPVTDPPNLAELSERDVLNVLEIVRKEFAIDETRIYLLGHSMGGAGALFLGAKYSTTWAAVASLSPAAPPEVLDPSILEPARNLPLLLMHGDADELVNVSNSRRWNQAILAVKMKDFIYKEVPGADHNGVAQPAMPDVFQFFAEHRRDTAR